MSEIDVMYTRTYNGDYLADFDCNADDLPKSNVFFYKAIQADELAALRASIAELEAQPATLTPRQCNRECYLRGWQAAIEAAADRADNCDLPYEAGSGVLWDHQVARRQATSDAITELQPPDECGDCNPLKPQSDANKHGVDYYHGMAEALKKIERVYCDNSPDRESALLLCYQTAARELNLQQEHAKDLDDCDHALTYGYGKKSFCVICNKELTE